MVERLTGSSERNQPGSLTEERIFRAVAVASSATALAGLLIPGMISGFLGLLRSTLEALFLPFRLLFSLALWLTTGTTISTAVNGVRTENFSHTSGELLLHVYTPAFAIVAGLVIYMAAGVRPVALPLVVALVLHLVAAGLIGSSLAGLLLPALVVEAASLYRLRHA